MVDAEIGVLKADLEKLHAAIDVRIARLRKLLYPKPIFDNIEHGYAVVRDWLANL